MRFKRRGRATLRRKSKHEEFSDYDGTNGLRVRAGRYIDIDIHPATNVLLHALENGWTVSSRHGKELFEGEAEIWANNRHVLQGRETLQTGDGASSGRLERRRRVWVVGREKDMPKPER